MDRSYPCNTRGMGVRISASGLAGAVANAGGVGVIASVALGLDSNHFLETGDYFQANVLALTDELRRAREISPKGVIWVNCMVAISDYKKMVTVSVLNGAQIIFTGAGLPLPELIKGNNEVALVPIVSSLRAADLITKRWWKFYRRIPDAIVYEDPDTAGRHLGARKEELYLGVPGMSSVIPQLAEWSATQYSSEIPVIAAGGIWDRQDIDFTFSLGAKGVQMSNRFIGTTECDASHAFKQAFLTADKSDVTIIDSPVGLPARALRTVFFRSVLGIPFSRLFFYQAGPVQKNCFTL